MRILLVSDAHGDVEKIRMLRAVERDVTIYAGDFVDCAHPSMDVLISVLEELARESFTIYVPGNCDPRDATRELNVSNSINVHGRYYKIDDNVIVGLGGSNITPFGTPLEFPEDEIERELESALKGVIDSNLIGEQEISSKLILLTHVPPFNTKLDVIATGSHVGSTAVRSFIERHRPRVSLHGHIHESQAVDTILSTTCVNPGALVHKRYAVIELSESRLQVRLGKL